MKRTRRIEIILYTRRITRRPGDVDAADGAEYSTSIDNFPMTQADTRSAPDQMDEAGSQAIDSAVRESERHPWFWLDWLKRD